MKKIIQLGTEKTGRLLNKEPFLLPDKLELDFQSIGYDLTSAFITLKNGEVKEKHKLIRPFTVPEKFIFAGLLNISVDAYKNGVLIKHWDILPIKIIETNEKMECFDLLADLDKRLTALEKQHEII